MQRSFFLLVLFFLPIRVSAAVMISELMWMGSDLSPSDEWIEFVCRDAETDLSGYRLVSVTGTGAEKEIYRFEEGILAESGAVFVLSNFSADASRLRDEPAFVSSNLSLPNTKLHLRLYDGSGSLIDEVDDGIGEPFAGANTTGEPKASMERISFDLPGSDPLAWSTAEVSLGFDSGALLFGTPGFWYEPQEVIEPELPNNVIPSIFINELLPDPVGSDDQEWIELINMGEADADLSLLQLEINGRITDLSGTIGAGELLLLPKSEFGFSLPNSGADIALLFDGEPVDTLSYEALTQGISIGRLVGEEDFTSICMPTPGFVNEDARQTLSLVVQSGQTEGIGSVSVNLQAVAIPPLPGLHSCRFDFGDGSVQETCNPSSHSFKEAGNYNVFVEGTTQCGNTITHQMTVTVREEILQESSSSSSQNSSEETCQPDSAARVEISEVLPAPKSGKQSGEWIELKNSSNKEISLCGWGIDDGEGGSKPMPLDRYAISPFGYLVLSGTTVSLNNDKDAVRLIAPDGFIAESVSYEKAMTDYVFAKKSDGTFTWSFIETPGRPNIFQQDLTIQVRVTRVIDGDTFVAETLSTSDLFPKGHEMHVRLIGIDTPETVDPDKPEEQGGSEASKFLRTLTEGKEIDLQFDTEITDTYERTLAYASLKDGRSIQEEILKNGFSKGYFRYSFARMDSFKTYEEFAKEHGYGLWSDETEEIEEALLDEEMSEDIIVDGNESVILSEIFARPDKNAESPFNEEWIEIHNLSEEKVWLFGWTLKDNGKGKGFVFSPSDFLEPREFMILPKLRTKLSLNDDGEVITLASPSGKMQTIEVPKISSAGLSYAYDGYAWCMSTISTPEKENECMEPISKTKSTSKKVVQSSTKKAVGSSSKRTASLLASLEHDESMHLEDEETTGDSGDTALWVSILGNALAGGFFFLKNRSRNI